MYGYMSSWLSKDVSWYFNKEKKSVSNNLCQEKKGFSNGKRGFSNFTSHHIKILTHNEF